MIVQIQDMNDRLEQCFRTFMAGRGYEEIPAAPISSKADRSVRLVGSAFSRLRSGLGRDAVSAFAVQRAIRTQILSTYYEEAAEREFCSYHVSYGAIVDAASVRKLTVDCIDLITQALQFDPRELRVRVSSKDAFFLEILRSSSLRDCLLADSEDDERYNHQYGDSLYGRGFKVDCRQADRFKNIVHVVAIFDRERGGQCVGAEMALTNASVLLRRYGLPYAVEVMPVAELLPCDTFARRRYADSLTVVTHLLFEGVRPNSSRMDGRLLKRYLKALHYFGGVLGIDEQTRIQHITDYARLEYRDDRLLGTDLVPIINNF